MKKNILTLFFVFISLIFVFMFFHSKDMVTKYNAGLSLSVDCKVFMDGYQNPSSKLDFSNALVFQNWQFCIAQDGYHFFYLLNIISIPVALLFAWLSFYIRKFELKISTKNLILILLSPLMLLFIFGFSFNAFRLFMNYKNGGALFENPNQLEGVMNNLLLLGVIFIIAVVKIIIRLVKKYKQFSKS